jgi:hypothetical protein
MKKFLLSVALWAVNRVEKGLAKVAAKYPNNDLLQDALVQLREVQTTLSNVKDSLRNA